MNSAASLHESSSVGRNCSDAELSGLIGAFLDATDRANGVHLIRSRSADSLFKPSELRILREETDRLAGESPTPLRQPHATVVLKATRLCNLRCSYCNSWAAGPGNVIGFRGLLRRTLEAIRGAASHSLDFVWHGGEMTLLNPALVEKMIWVQEHYRPASLRVSNSIQTNGVAIGDRWLDLLSAIPISVGVSIDGPPHIHDLYRRAADGSASYDRVLAGLRALQSRNIPFGALIVVGRMTLEMEISSYLDWLLESGIHNVDFLNVAPCDDDIRAGVPDEEFVPVDEFVLWLAEVHDHLRREPRWRDIRVRFIEDITAAMEEQRSPASCYFSGKCFANVMTVNPSGSVSPCDKYVTTPASEMDQPLATGLVEAVTRLSTLQRGYGSDNWVEPDACRWRHLCRGGCPHDSQALSARLGAKLTCCGFSPLFDRIAAQLREPAPQAG